MRGPCLKDKNESFVSSEKALSPGAERAEPALVAAWLSFLDDVEAVVADDVVKKQQLADIYLRLGATL